MDARSKNTFTFPDSSDVEDEDVYDEFSGDEAAEDEQTSSEDGVSIESPVAKTSAAVDPIDLTGDDTPLVFPSNRIDLTGETAFEQGLMDMMEGRPVDIPNNADPVSIGVYAGSKPIFVDSDEEDAHFSIDSDNESEKAEGDVTSENDSHDEAEDLENAADDAEDSDMEDVQESSAMESEVAEALTGHVRFALATHDTSCVILSDVRTRIEEPEDVADDDDESDFGLSEAGQAGIQALFDDGLLSNNFEASSPILSEMKHVSFATTQARQDDTSGEGQSSSQYSRFQAAQRTLRHELGLSDPVARQPSPSDAAMVKGCVPARDPAHVGVCDLGEISRPAAQTLGERTGKGDFFEAREINKAKFNANKASQASATDTTTAPVFAGGFEQIRPQPMTTSAFGRRQYEHVFGATQSANPSAGSAFNFGEYSFSAPSNNGTSAANKLSPADTICKTTVHVFKNLLLMSSDFPTREPCSFLDNPAHVPALDRVPSPEPYMTSAVNFNAATQKPRSGLGINDIINNTTSTTTQSLKRKAAEISDATDAELKMWAQSSTTSNGDANGSPDLTNPKEQATVSSPSTDAVPAVAGAPNPRPTKKAKKFMENFGYAVLGGVAVGAGLFSALVATAPDFL